MSEVRSVLLDGNAGTARVDLRPGAVIAETLRRLATAAKSDAVGQGGPDFGQAALRRMRQPRFHLFRHGDRVSTWEVLHDQPGRLRLRHELLHSDPLLPHRIDSALGNIDGVAGAVSRPLTGTVLIHFDPHSIDSGRLLEILDEALEEPGTEPNALHPSEIRFGLANTSLALAAAGEFAVPELLPISALLLLVSNRGNFRDAWRQLRRRQMGLPLLYSAIVVGTLGTGQFLVAASMSWLIKFWHRQYAWRLASARRRLFEPLVRRQPLVNVIEGDEIRSLPVASVTQGQVLFAQAGETLPVGGQVLSGYALVDESLVRGSEGLVPKAPGDEVFAASRIVAGRLQVKVERCGLDTRVAALSQAMAAALMPDRGQLAPSTHGEQFAQRAVGPTLATAGLGLLVGDVSTAATILRPDYATGPGLAVPLETLASVFACAQQGIVVRDTAALDRLAEADLILFDCREALERTGLEVADVSCDAELMEHELLRLAATALARVDDDRAQALLGACRQRGVAWSEETQLDVGPGITIYEGGKRISIMDESRSAERSPVERRQAAPLAIVVDGLHAGRITFKVSNRRLGQAAIEQLQAAAAPELGVFFDRGRPNEIGWVAGLSIDAQIAATTLEQKVAFLRECREEGRKVALVGEGPIDDELQRQAHVAIALANDDTWQSATAPLVLLQPRLSKVVALWNVAHARHREVGVAHRYALVPNLFCVAGAFFFGFTSLAAVALTNVGTLATFHRINRRLCRLEPPPKVETVAAEPASAEQQTVERIEHLPKEVGALLISVGVAGMMLPGLVGAPAVLAGGLVLWPGTFGKLEDWFQRRCPEVHKKGVRQMARYLDDLETRYPIYTQKPPPAPESQTCNA